MRDIKGEIGELMSKIDNASREIIDSYSGGGGAFLNKKQSD